MFSIREIIFGPAALPKPPLTTEGSPSEQQRAVSGWVTRTGSGDVSIAGNGDTTRAKIQLKRVIPLISFRSTANRADDKKTFGRGPLSALSGNIAPRHRQSGPRRSTCPA